MFIIDGMVRAIDYLKSNFKLTIGKRTIEDESDDGQKYNKTIWFMKDKALFDFSMIKIIHNERMYVVEVLEYICNHLEWGTNAIILDNSQISTDRNLNKPDVSRGISRLVELNIIVKAKTLDRYKKDNSINNKLYIVNHNKLFKGNTKNMKKDFDKQ